MAYENESHHLVLTLLILVVEASLYSVGRHWRRDTGKGQCAFPLNFSPSKIFHNTTSGL